MIESKEEQEQAQDLESFERSSRSAESRVPEGARLLTLSQASVYTNLSYWTLRDWINDGILPVVKLPGGRQKNRAGVITKKAGDASNRKILIDRQDLDRLIAESKVNRG